MQYSKHKRLISGQIKELGFLEMTSSLALAVASTVWAIYFQSIINDTSRVGFANTVFGIVGVISFIAFIPLLERHSKTKVLGFSLLLYAASYFLFSINKSILFAIVLGVLVYSSAAMRVNALGIILRDKSKKSSVSKNTGLIYTLLNSAWLFGPLIAGFVSSRFGINWVFFVAGILMFLSWAFLKFSGFKDDRKEKKVDRHLVKFVGEFFSEKKLIVNYIVRGGISFWWAFIYIFIPIYIITTKGVRGDLLVGYFLAGVVAPLIFLEYPFGRIAGKRGFRKMFLRGYIILTLISVLCFFVNEFYAILVLLVLGSVGAAMLEPTTDAYFFDITNKYQRDKYYGIYNTSLDVFYALSLFVVAWSIKLFNFKYAFLVVGFFMLVFGLISLGVKKVIEEKSEVGEFDGV